LIALDTQKVEKETVRKSISPAKGDEGVGTWTGGKRADRARRHEGGGSRTVSLILAGIRKKKK